MNIETMHEITEKFPMDYEIVIIEKDIIKNIKNKFEVDIDNKKIILKTM